ncbi:MAG: amino acid ABC transporter substrate-binding protein [Cyanobacteria bacterium P01_F01_bin.42]
MKSFAVLRLMGRAGASCLCGAVLLGSLAQVASAESVMEIETILERVARTGTLTAGTSSEAFPFAFADDRGEIQGYSIDMLRQIQDRLSQHLGQQVRLDFIALRPEERISSLLANEVDIICDASSYTWDREQQIDFSVSYGLTGTRLLGPRGSTSWNRDVLSSKRIAVVEGTTNEIAVRQALPQAQVVVVDDHAQGYKMISQRRADVFAADGILLEGWLYSSSRADAFEIFEEFSREGIACMMPENNSDFANQVNYSLVRFMSGYLKQQQPYVDIFDRWFGPEAKVPLTQDVRALVLETMQLIIDFKEEIPESDL